LLLLSAFVLAPSKSDAEKVANILGERIPSSQLFRDPRVQTREALELARKTIADKLESLSALENDPVRTHI